MLPLILLSFLAVTPAGEPTRWQVGHALYRMAISADGKILALGGARQDDDSSASSGLLTLLDTATGKPRRVIETQRAVTALAFSPDSKRLLIGETGRGGTIAAGKRGSVFPRVWDVETGKAVLALDGHTDAINGTAFFPDGKRLITASGDGTIRIWDADTGNELRVLKTGWFNDDLALSPDGKLAAAGSGNAIVSIWDTHTGKEHLKLELEYSGHNIAFAPGGSLIAVCSRGINEITLWDARNGTSKGTIKIGFDPVRDTIIGGNVTSNLLFSPDAKWLITGADSPQSAQRRAGQVYVWNVEKRKYHTNTTPAPDHIRRLTFTPDGQRLLAACADGTVLGWDFAALISDKK